MRQLRTFITTALLVAVAAGACNDAGADEAGLSVVVTTTILGDVVSNIVGEDATVEVLLPAGADPHEFQASSQQVAAIVSADLVVANGLGLEESLTDVLENAASEGANVLEIAARLDPVPFSQDPEAGLDPHVWLDPQRMADAVMLIATELTALDPGIEWSERAETYAAALEAADADIARTLAVIPAASRVLVTNHDVLGYFAARYDFEVVGTIVPGGATLADPSSDDLAELVALIDERNIPAIFAETTEPLGLAEAIAAELDRNVDVIALHTESLGESGSGAETLIGMLQTNAELIVSGLT